jgi:hypothetical protein
LIGAAIDLFHNRQRQSMRDKSIYRSIDANAVASEDLLQQWCDQIGNAGLRGTASAAHERTIAWVEDELRRLPGLIVRTDEYDVLRWQPVPEGDLENAGGLRIINPDGSSGDIFVAGAVPYTLPAQRQGNLIHLPRGKSITPENARGKVVLLDFPHIPLPYDVLLANALHTSAGAAALRGEIFDRPGLADTILHHDLLAAGRAGAAGVVIAFDLPRDQIAGYFEPHKGTHYGVPAVFVGVDEREQLRPLAAAQSTVAEVTVHAQVAPSRTRNVFARLEGQTEERIVLVTHTDGNTWVQENGIAALLALAAYFAKLPIEHRRRTLEFAFTSAHLHISREGSLRYAQQLDREFDDGTVAFVFPIEHLGARELVPVPRQNGPSRRLEFTGASEPLLWAVGPSAALQQAVIDATKSRHLERVIVAPGFGPAQEGRVPRIVSFGGLGTNFHTHLLPTTSIITGPWSLWAPAFGRDAIDISQLRQQVLAAGDVVLNLDGVARDEIAGDYLKDRDARAAGASTGTDEEPPEVASSDP